MMPPPRELTALVVDDEQYFRRFVAELLQSQGFARALEARDGQEALEHFGLQRPDFVVLDINMPRTDGLEVLRGIRRQCGVVPIVMLTSVADEMVVERCVDEGATYFIRKDVPANELMEEMRALVRVCVPEASANL